MLRIILPNLEPKTSTGPNTRWSGCDNLSGATTQMRKILLSHTELKAQKGRGTLYLVQVV